MKRLAKTLVIGIGNPIMQDDGIGVHVIHRLKAEQPVSSHIEFVDGGTLGFFLIGEIESADNLIVIDAAQIDARPGMIRTFAGEAMDRFLGQQKNSSVHDVTLVDLLSIAMLADRLPVRRALVGIQPESVELGTEPTLALELAIPKACRATLQLIAEWSA